MKFRKTLISLTASTTVLGAGTFAADRAIDPYTDAGLRLEIAEASTLKGAGENKVELVKSRPEVRFKKWNGEVDLGIRYDKIQAPGSRAFLTDRMEWKQGKEELHAYPLPAGPGMEDGGFEIEVYLTEPPDSNVFEFQIDNADELDFFYQPELTPQEIAEGAERPENVVGSYAVYHKTNANHRVGSTNYATGKAFHIYRPKAIDANGAETWAELSYATGGLSVAVDQKWLSEAIYPVVVDPTFGYTTIGASSLLGADFAGSKYQAPGNGTVTLITTYVTVVNNATDVQFGYYNDNAGAVGTHISHAAAAASPGDGFQDWYSQSVSGLITSGNQYWLVEQSEDNSGADVDVRYDTGGTTDQLRSHVTFVEFDWTNSPTLTAALDATLSIYATYTADAGGGATDIGTFFWGEE